MIANHPQPIRSDEWLVGSQMILAQKNDNFARINKNVGNGEDVSLIIDVPYREWSVIFKPHNLGFFVLPFDNAFAFRWWLMAYLLVMSCYFFVLTLLPGKRLLAALLSISLLYNPFLQWWYLYSTLGSLYYTLFAGVIAMKLLNQQQSWKRLLWGAALAYVLTCFALVLYPPFQIPCALAMLAFVVGYSFEKLRGEPRKLVLQKLGMLAGSAAAAGGLALVFLLTRLNVVRAVENTTYPGNRLQLSGGYNAAHLFSAHLGAQFQNMIRASHYLVAGATNQSEASNFVLLLPFLLLPSGYLVWKYYRRQHAIDWPLVLVNGAFLGALLWLFVPHLGIIGKITFLNRVPHSRLLIGLGLLNIIQTVLVIRRYTALKDFVIARTWVVPYALAVFLAELGLGVIAMRHSPGFIGMYRVVAFSLPVPVVIYMILRKHFEWAALGLLAFLVMMSFPVNPLYRGTSTLQDTPVSTAIRSITARDSSAWAVEYFTLENFVIMNGGHSLSGVYVYPQLGLWRNVDPTASEAVYNRYAHVSFTFDRDRAGTAPTRLTLLGADHFGVTTEPCSQFLHQNNVHYLLTQAPLNSNAACASLLQRVRYPALTFYIYHLN